MSRRRQHRRSSLIPPPRRPEGQEKQNFVSAVWHLFFYWLIHLIINTL